MQNGGSQARVMDFAEIWHGAQRRRTEEISADINNLKTISVFSGVGLLVSLVLASHGWDSDSGFSKLAARGRRRMASSGRCAGLTAMAPPSLCN
jgi:hypothetical protein